MNRLSSSCECQLILSVFLPVAQQKRKHKSKTHKLQVIKTKAVQIEEGNLNHFHLCRLYSGFYQIQGRGGTIKNAAKESKEKFYSIKIGTL